MSDQEQIASAATATAFYPSIVVNLQLSDWIEAKAKFHKLHDWNYHWSEATKVVNLLGNSLNTLFGMNHQSQGRTPALSNYIENNFYGKNWDLKSESQNLHQRFTELDILYKDITKHMDGAKVEKAQTALATLDLLARQMETTRQVWIWFLGKRASVRPVQADQLVEFREKFE